MTEGSGLPWLNHTWSQPRIIISGHTPSGCIDRRPSRMSIDPPSSDEPITTAPDANVPACEFDGSTIRWASNRKLLLPFPSVQYQPSNPAFCRISPCAPPRRVSHLCACQPARGLSAWRTFRADNVERRWPYLESTLALDTCPQTPARQGRLVLVPRANKSCGFVLVARTIPCQPATARMRGARFLEERH